MRMPFGKHKGNNIGTIPTNYLLWMLTTDMDVALKIDASRVLSNGSRLYDLRNIIRNGIDIEQQRMANRILCGQAVFSTELEKTWAAFFNLAKFTTARRRYYYRWAHKSFSPSGRLSPINGWQPDFLLDIPCGHSECSESHTILIEIQPFSQIGQFDGHPSQLYWYGCNGCCASASFGANPSVTYWQMAHGAGGGSESICDWVDGDAMSLWEQATAIAS